MKLYPNRDNKDKTDKLIIWIINKQQFLSAGISIQTKIIQICILETNSYYKIQLSNRKQAINSNLKEPNFLKLNFKGHKLIQLLTNKIKTCSFRIKIINYYKKTVNN